MDGTAYLALTASSQSARSLSRRSGDSGGYITTSIDLPNAFDDQNIEFRWQFATDNSVSATGWRIDTIALTTVPEPATLALFGIALAGLGFARRRRTR